MTIPVDSGPDRPKPRYPFADMRPGQSFVLPPGASLNGCRAAASRYGKHHGQTFSIRTLPTRPVPVVRCWRVT
jgi:hypothetical protein